MAFTKRYAEAFPGRYRIEHVDDTTALRTRSRPLLVGAWSVLVMGTVCAIVWHSDATALLFNIMFTVVGLLLAGIFTGFAVYASKRPPILLFDHGQNTLSVPKVEWEANISSAKLGLGIIQSFPTPMERKIVLMLYIITQNEQRPLVSFDYSKARYLFTAQPIENIESLPGLAPMRRPIQEFASTIGMELVEVPMVIEGGEAGFSDTGTVL